MKTQSTNDDRLLQSDLHDSTAAGASSCDALIKRRQVHIGGGGDSTLGRMRDRACKIGKKKDGVWADDMEFILNIPPSFT